VIFTSKRSGFSGKECEHKTRQLNQTRCYRSAASRISSDFSSLSNREKNPLQRVKQTGSAAPKKAIFPPKPCIRQATGQIVKWVKTDAVTFAP
jgi:hypothetical protein